MAATAVRQPRQLFVTGLGKEHCRDYVVHIEKNIHWKGIAWIRPFDIDLSA
jgi:hypothetical protein